MENNMGDQDRIDCSPSKRGCLPTFKLTGLEETTRKGVHKSAQLPERLGSEILPEIESGTGEK